MNYTTPSAGGSNGSPPQGQSPNGDSASAEAALAPNQANNAGTPPRTFRDGDDVLREIGSIVWVWPGHIAEGLATGIAALPDHLKTTLSLRLAGSITEGWPWPDGTPIPEKYRGKCVLLLNTEGSIGPDIERAKAMGLTPGKLREPLFSDGAAFTLTSQSHLDAVGAELKRGDYAMIVLDSLTFADAANEKNALIGQNLRGLIALANTYHVALIVVTHERKPSQENSNPEPNPANVRGHGSIVAVFRIIFQIDRPNPSSAICRVTNTKNNYAKRWVPFGIELVEHPGGCLELIYHQTPPTRPPGPAASNSASRPPSDQDRAIEIIKGLLADGTPKPKAEVQRRVEEGGIPERTYRRAVAELRGDGRLVESRQDNPERGKRIECFAWAQEEGDKPDTSLEGVSRVSDVRGVSDPPAKPIQLN